MTDTLTSRLIYHDAWLLAVCKPAGLLTTPGRGPDLRDSLLTRLLRHYPEARVVHRLDRDTSGVLLLALDADTHRALSRQFEQRRVGKTYQAICHGGLTPDEGEIRLPLAKWFAAPPRHRVDYSFGKPARTDYRVLDRRDNRTWVELLPQSGRSHQLRVHLAAVGHPIIGDPLYGAAWPAATGDRLYLHAERLRVTHPATNRELEFVAACPWQLPAAA